MPENEINRAEVVPRLAKVIEEQCPELLPSLEEITEEASEGTFTEPPEVVLAFRRSEILSVAANYIITEYENAHAIAGAAENKKELEALRRQLKKALESTESLTVHNVDRLRLLTKYAKYSGPIDPAKIVEQETKTAHELGYGKPKLSFGAGYEPIFSYGGKSRLYDFSEDVFLSSKNALEYLFEGVQILEGEQKAKKKKRGKYQASMVAQACQQACQMTWCKAKVYAPTSLNNSNMEKKGFAKFVKSVLGIFSIETRVKSALASLDEIEGDGHGHLVIRRSF